MSPATVKKAEPKVVRVKSGRIDAMLQSVGKTFDAQNEGQHHRWVYDPPNSPQNSHVPFRQSEGYRFVEPEEIEGIDLEYLIVTGKERIRIGDVVLMKIPSLLREKYLKEVHEAANNQLDRVGREFATELNSKVVRGKDGKKAKANPIGEVTNTVEEKEIDIPQRVSED